MTEGLEQLPVTQNICQWVTQPLNVTLCPDQVKITMEALRRLSREEHQPGHSSQHDTVSPITTRKAESVESAGQQWLTSLVATRLNPLSSPAPYVKNVIGKALAECLLLLLNNKQWPDYSPEGHLLHRWGLSRPTAWLTQELQQACMAVKLQYEAGNASEWKGMLPCMQLTL